jgi:hypothetical protein
MTSNKHTVGIAAGQGANGIVSAVEGSPGQAGEKGVNTGAFLGPLDPGLFGNVGEGASDAGVNSSSVEVTSQQPAVLQHIEQLWTSFDQRVMQPVFGGPGAQGNNGAAQQTLMEQESASQQQQSPMGVFSRNTAAEAGADPLQPWVDSGEAGNV